MERTIALFSTVVHLINLITYRAARARTAALIRRFKLGKCALMAANIERYIIRGKCSLNKLMTLKPRNYL